MLKGLPPEDAPEFFDTIDTLFLILSTTGKIILINRVCRETMGYSSKEAEGKYFLKLLFKSKVHNLIRSLLEEAKEPPYRTTYEDNWQMQNGCERLISFTVASLRDDSGSTINYTVTGLDITRFRKMEEDSEILGQRKDGSVFSAEANISQLEIEGEKIYTAILRDVSERKIIENDLRESLAEKEILLQEVHHRVKNNLQVISSLFTLQSNSTNDPDRLALLRESQHRIQSMALIHEKIYQSENLAQINFQHYVRDLVTEIFQSYQTSSVNVRLSFELEPVLLEINRAIPCALILNELTSNALKYAFAEQKNGNLKFVLKVENEQQLVLTVSDDGKGIPDKIKFSSAKTLGLRLVRVLTRQLNGKVELKQNPECLKSRGTMFIFHIPLK